MVARIWSDLLATPVIERHDNFFSLGGHSLLAMRFVASMREQLGTELPVRSLMTASLCQIATLLNPQDQGTTREGVRTKLEFEPFFFESRDHRLYAVHHSPVGNVRGALLLCQPIGHEYIRLQRCVRILAEKLASNGYHVLRFDYAGTGDSSGELADMSISIWQRNVEDALQQLSYRSQCESSGGIGIRFGATLLAAMGKHLSSIVLWDPVASGRAHMQQHNAMTYAAMSNLDRYRFRHSRKYAAEFFGFMYGKTFLDEIRQIQFNDQVHELPEQLLLLHSELADSNTSLSDRLGLAERAFDEIGLDENQRWDDFRVADDMVLAFRSVNTITDWYS